MRGAVAISRKASRREFCPAPHLFPFWRKFMTARTPSWVKWWLQEQKPHNKHGGRERQSGGPNAHRDTSPLGVHLQTYVQEEHALVSWLSCALTLCPALCQMLYGHRYADSSHTFHEVRTLISQFWDEETSTQLKLQHSPLPKDT